MPFTTKPTSASKSSKTSNHRVAADATPFYRKTNEALHSHPVTTMPFTTKPTSASKSSKTSNHRVAADATPLKNELLKHYIVIQ